MLHRVKAKVVSRIVSALTASIFSTVCYSDINQAFELDLPRQTLTKSIIDLGKSSEISIIVPSYLLKDITSVPLNGNYTPRQALEKLLEQTPLTFREINPRVIAIVPRQNTTKQSYFTDHIVEELVIIGRQVTGSFLDRIDLQGTSPVDIITKHELDISGSQNVAEFLKFIPAVSGNSTSTAISNGGDGTATVTLRGLPANNTLVLINGRRINSEGLDGDSIDLNSIPSAVVERIEILKDGASAIYGTDAIAGVVNIILKREYNGFQFEQYFGTSYKNDIETSSTHILWGDANDRGAFLISAQHFDQNGLFSRERAVSATADGRSRGGTDKRSSATPDSRITLDDTVVTLRDGASGTAPSDFRPVTDEDRFNFLSQTSTISPSNRQSIFFSGHLGLTDSITLSTDASYNQTQATITLASTPLFTAFENTPIVVAENNIYNPFSQPVQDIRRRILELPPREQENKTTATRISLSLEGFSDSISWELNGNWNKTEAKEHSSHLLDEDRTRRALGPSAACLGTNIDGCEPLNLFGPSGSITDTQLAFVQSVSVTKGFTKLYGVNGNLSSHIFDLPAGAVYGAIGFDSRREQVDSKPVGIDSPSNNIGDVSKGPTIGSRKIHEVFFETQLPIVRRVKAVYSFDLGLAVRYSDYSDFGNNTSPKFGIRYRPIPQLLLRSTYSEGFRAPNLGELFTGNFQSQLPLTDLCSFQENVGVLPGCTLLSDDTRTQYLVTFSGEPNLKPETSESYTIGLVWTPRSINDLYVSVDQFNIDQKDIVTANAQLILDRNARFNDFGELITRDANGEITQLHAPFINIGQRKVSGIDTTIRYISKNDTRGTISYSLNASYLDEYKFKLDRNSDYEGLEGTFVDAANEGSGALPKWKANVGVFWSFKNIGFSYSINYISSVTERIPFTENKKRKINSWITHDTQASYKFGKNKNLKFTLGIDNIWNEAPPFAASAFNDNYDARTYDIKGQFLYGKLLYTF